jgi:hypothetical protein
MLQSRSARGEGAANKFPWLEEVKGMWHVTMVDNVGCDMWHLPLLRLVCDVRVKSVPIPIFERTAVASHQHSSEDHACSF